MLQIQIRLQFTRYQCKSVGLSVSQCASTVSVRLREHNCEWRGVEKSMTSGEKQGRENFTYSVPLSTIWVSREMPSRLINSWAKVMSLDELASSFNASSFMSRLLDWTRSCSCRAIWAWECSQQKRAHGVTDTHIQTEVITRLEGSQTAFILWTVAIKYSYPTLVLNFTVYYLICVLLKPKVCNHFSINPNIKM